MDFTDFVAALVARQAAPATEEAAGVLSRHTVTSIANQALTKARPVTFAVTTVTLPVTNLPHRFTGSPPSKLWMRS